MHSNYAINHDNKAVFYLTLLTKEPCLNICLNIKLHRPDANEDKCRLMSTKL